MDNRHLGWIIVGAYKYLLTTDGKWIRTLNDINFGCPAISLNEEELINKIASLTEVISRYIDAVEANLDQRSKLFYFTEMKEELKKIKDG